MNWFSSTTIQGLIVSLLGFLLAKFGLAESILPDQVANIAEILMQIGGLALAAYGRKKAQGPL